MYRIKFADAYDLQRKYDFYFRSMVIKMQMVSTGVNAEVGEVSFHITWW